jgi:hypothetical protein
VSVTTPAGIHRGQFAGNPRPVAAQPSDLASCRRLPKNTNEHYVINKEARKAFFFIKIHFNRLPHQKNVSKM